MKKGFSMALIDRITGAARVLSGRDEKEGATVAIIAARGVRKPFGLTMEEIKVVCASALTQRPNRPK